MKRQKHTFNTIAKRILIGLGIVILSAIITVVLVRLFYSPSVEKVTTSTISPPDIIKKYTEGYKLDGYKLDTSMTDSIISYKLSDTAYTVQISTLDNIQFTKSENSNESDIASAAEKSKAFITDNGLRAVPGQANADSTRVLYESENTVCKTFNSFDPTKKASAYGLVCTDKKALIAERDAIKKLLKLYTDAGGTEDYKDIARTVYTEGNKSLNTLSINPQKTSTAPYTLIFASIDNKWSYIGNRVTPSIDVQESFKISDTLKKAINDPKYGGFLAKYIY